MAQTRDRQEEHHTAWGTDESGNASYVTHLSSYTLSDGTKREKNKKYWGCGREIQNPGNHIPLVFLENAAICTTGKIKFQECPVGSLPWREKYIYHIN